jgi:DNA-binding transcriptional regulator YiaG
MTEEEKEIFAAAVAAVKSCTNLAKRLKVSTQTVRNWRRNVSKPKQEYIQEMKLITAAKPHG